MRYALLLVLIPLLGCCRSPESKGAKDARAAIEAGDPHLVFIGLPNFEVGRLDAETGLKTSTLGCIVSDDQVAYEAAFNREIRRALAAGELDEYLLKHKVTTREAVAARFAKEDGGRLLVMDAPAADAPGGRYRVAVRTESEESKKPYLFVTDVKAGTTEELIFLGSNEAHILFDHGGTTLLVRDDYYKTYMTFDLPTLLFMQGFRDS